ncbi:MAG TPA: YidC/Oxa1 family membrane protein insertase [Limnochordia bacterium]
MGIISYLVGLMRETLIWLADVTGSYGVGIILLTILIRAALYPLTLSQMKSAVAMRALQPKMKELQERYKEKPEEYQKRVLQLYRENKVNPLGGCLPLLIQLPFMWALYVVLRDFDFHTRFLVWDLAGAAKDPLFILPVLTGLTMYLQSAMTLTDPSQRAIVWIFPIFMAWVTTNFPAGLAIYWVVSNLVSIGQQYLLMRQTGTPRAGGATR